MPKTPGLRELRKRAALSQEELAEASGTSRATIADLEAGNRGAWPQTIRKLADALGVDPEDLYAEPDSGKVEAPPSQARLFNGLEEEQRRAQRENLTNALLEYWKHRAADYDRDLRDPESPHFRSATAARLWQELVYRELRACIAWTMEHLDLLAAQDADEDREYVRGFLLLVIGVGGTFKALARRAERRITAMDEPPDELADRRTRQARASAEQAQKELQTVEEAV